MDSDTATLSALELGKLKWRCRRGLLENDLILEKFFARHESGLTVRQAQGLHDLMELADNDLLDFLLMRKEPEAGTVTKESMDVLGMLRMAVREPLANTPGTRA